MMQNAKKIKQQNNYRLHQQKYSVKRKYSLFCISQVILKILHQVVGIESLNGH